MSDWVLVYFILLTEFEPNLLLFLFLLRFLPLVRRIGDFPLDISCRPHEMFMLVWFCLFKITWPSPMYFLFILTFLVLVCKELAWLLKSIQLSDLIKEWNEILLHVGHTMSFSRLAVSAGRISMLDFHSLLKFRTLTL